MSRPLLAALAALVLALPGAVRAQARGPDAGWVGAWEAGLAAQAATPEAPLKPLRNQTLRQEMKVSLGGRRVRVLLSNAYGTRPLVVGSATIAKLVGGALDPASVRPLTFGGEPKATLAIGAPALSDPVDLPLAAGEEAAVSLYLPQETLPETYHRGQTGVPTRTVVSSEGDFTRAASIPGAAASPRLFVARIDVLNPQAGGAVVVLGTTRAVGEGRWPEILARRLAGRRPMSVVNASMVANPLTRPFPGAGEAGMARFDRDVLAVPGVSHVIVTDPINDIGQAEGASPAKVPTVEELASAYRQLVARAHARGVKVIAGTFLPIEGVPFAGFYTPAKDQVRVAFNRWLLGAGIFDGVIDFDAIVRDPANPLRYAPGLAAANNFTPSEAGEQKIGETIDLSLFR